jgi:hypothetical protein
MELHHMPRPKASPNSYRDVRPMLDAALGAGDRGARFSCGSRENAIRMVQRMNQFRLITRRMNFEQHKAAGPQHNETRDRWAFEVQNMKWHISEYDDLIIRYPRDEWIIIDRKPDRPFIEAFDGEGNPLDVAMPEPNVATPWIEPSPQTMRPIIPHGTTQAPREKFDPSKSLDLTDEC